MSSHTLTPLFDVHRDNKITGPPAALHRSSVTGSSSLELDEIAWGSPLSGPVRGDVESRTSLPDTVGDLDVSQSIDARQNRVVEVVQSWSNPPINKWRVLSACCEMFGDGLNDSAPGALIPYIEHHYHIGYAIVSLIFVTNALGFILAAFSTNVIESRIGRAKALVVSELALTAGCVMIVCTPPFALVVVAYLFLGFGEAVNLALNNTWAANLADSTTVLGAVQGGYGIGGIAGPLIATALTSHGILWSRFYFIPIGIRLLCLAFALWAFWDFERDNPAHAPQASSAPPTPNKTQMLKEALKKRVTLVGALFIFAYQGAEVAISGWVISFLINYRGGRPSDVGYITAGFWGGITFGRFVLNPIANRLGEKPFVYGLAGGAVGLQLLVWLVPNLIGGAVAVALLGLLLGPVYPCAITIFAKLLPRHLQMLSISFVSSAGSSGGAIAPFTVGILSEAVGLYVLHPVCIGLYAVMAVCWFSLPKVEKRDE